MNKQDRINLSMELFKKGYNCAQAVALSFSDLVNINEQELSKLCSSFGGGMGRMREVCGSVSGMFIIIGLLKGYDGPEVGDLKKDHYQRIQDLAKSFKDKNGSINCKELTGIADNSSTPTERSDLFYKKRPCLFLVSDAVEILCDFLKIG